MLLKGLFNESCLKKGFVVKNDSKGLFVKAWFKDGVQIAFLFEKVFSQEGVLKGCFK